MIVTTSGDMFGNGANYIVNTVNCFGVMGSGIAKLFKERYPKMFLDYKEKCKEKKIYPGTIDVYKENDLTIINFATKNHWKNQSRYEWIDSGLNELQKFLQDKTGKICIPALGCGHGGLKFDIVETMIKNHLSDLNMEITLFKPVSFK